MRCPWQETSLLGTEAVKLNAIWPLHSSKGSVLSARADNLLPKCTDNLWKAHAGWARVVDFLTAFHGPRQLRRRLRPAEKAIETGRRVCLAWSSKKDTPGARDIIVRCSEARERHPLGLTWNIWGSRWKASHECFPKFIASWREPSAGSLTEP